MGEVVSRLFVFAILYRVAHASDSVQQFNLERIVYFCPQSTDSYFHDVGIAVEVHVPDMFR